MLITSAAAKSLHRLCLCQPLASIDKVRCLDIGQGSSPSFRPGLVSVDGRLAAGWAYGRHSNGCAVAVVWGRLHTERVNACQHGHILWHANAPQSRAIDYREQGTCRKPCSLTENTDRVEQTGCRREGGAEMVEETGWRREDGGDRVEERGWGRQGARKRVEETG